MNETCPFCDSKFRDENLLRDHVEKKHGIVYGDSYDLISAWYELAPSRLTDFPRSEFKENGESQGMEETTI